MSLCCPEGCGRHLQEWKKGRSGLSFQVRYDSGPGQQGDDLIEAVVMNHRTLRASASRKETSTSLLGALQGFTSSNWLTGRTHRTALKFAIRFTTVG